MLHLCLRFNTYSNAIRLTYLKPCEDMANVLDVNIDSIISGMENHEAVFSISESESLINGRQFTASPLYFRPFPYH
jgi:hypothetical protein